MITLEWGVSITQQPVEQPIVNTILDTHNIDTARAQFTTVIAFLRFVTITDGWRVGELIVHLTVVAQSVFVTNCSIESHRPTLSPISRLKI